MSAARLILVSTLITAAACGGGGGETTSPEAGSPEVEGPVPPAADTIVMRDNVFEPSELSVPSEGGVIEITLINEGAAQHNFSYQFQAGGSFGAVSNDVSPGEQDVHDDEVPPGTTIEFSCEYHREQGMTGTLVVT